MSANVAIVLCMNLLRVVLPLLKVSWDGTSYNIEHFIHD
jgi:hypothetical protein